MPRVRAAVEVAKLRPKVDVPVTVSAAPLAVAMSAPTVVVAVAIVRHSGSPVESEAAVRTVCLYGYPSAVGLEVVSAAASVPVVRH
jgi:hypothetical protein